MFVGSSTADIAALLDTVLWSGIQRKIVVLLDALPRVASPKLPA